jgi:hypothetical protein
MDKIHFFHSSFFKFLFQMSSPILSASSSSNRDTVIVNMDFPSLSGIIEQVGVQMDAMQSARVISPPTPDTPLVTKKRKADEVLLASKIPKKFQPTDIFTIGVVTKSDLCASGYLNNYSCPICLEHFSLDSTYLKLRCSHVYHPGCGLAVFKVLSADNFCSLCKTCRFPNPNKIPVLKLSAEDREYMEHEIQNLNAETRFREALIYHKYLNHAKKYKEAEIAKLKRSMDIMGKEIAMMEVARREAFESPLRVEIVDETDERDNMAAIQEVLRADLEEVNQRAINVIVEHSSDEEDSGNEFIRSNWYNSRNGITTRRRL